MNKQEYEQKKNEIMEQLPKEQRLFYQRLKDACDGRKGIYFKSQSDNSLDANQKITIKQESDKAYANVVNFEKKIGIHKLGMEYARACAKRLK